MQYPTYALPVHFTVSHSTGRLTTKPYQTPPQPPQRHMHNPGESKQGKPHQKHAQNNKLHKAIHISSSPCLDDVKSNKQEGTLASYMKRKKTSSKIVVWCVRCPQGTFWQVHHRVAQQSPSRNLHPPPTHPTRPQTLMYHRTAGARKPSQAKPSQAAPETHTQETNSSTKPSTPPSPCCFVHSPAVPWPNWSSSSIQQHVQTMHRH